MVAKKKSTSKQEEAKGKVKVSKLKLNKETIKELTGGEAKQVKGGFGKIPFPSVGCVTGGCNPRVRPCSEDYSGCV